MNRILPWLAAVAAYSGTISADTFNVTRTDDPAPDGCSPGDCSLREAVIDANQTVQADLILLPAGTYLIDLDGSDSSDEVGDLDITTDMEISGAPSTIDAQGLGRILDITGDADVTLRKLTLQNANSSLATNNALNGGAIEANGDSLKLFNVTFLNNSSQSSGGALYVYDSSQVEIDGCLFTGNGADNGAAIRASVGITVRDTVFENNVADLNGSVAYLTGTTSDSLFERVRFEGNTAVNSAGAIHHTGRNLTVDILVATGNEATGGQGGVIFVPGTAHTKELYVTDARFNGNMAENGGAIATSDDDDTIDIRQSGFVGNQATSGHGGALYLTGGMVSVVNDTFSANQASNNGGAIYQFGGDLRLRHATISEGSAGAGDALFVNGNAQVSVLELANNVIDGACDIDDPLSLTSLGGNVEGPGDSCGLDAATDLVGQSALQIGLQALRANYRATPTHQLTLGSVARGNGEAAVCTEVEVDQLSLPREMCSSGAVESEEIFSDTLEISPFEI